MKIDARGLACPAPVLKAKEAVEQSRPKELTVVVDNEAARQNVSRFLNSQGFSVSVQQTGDGIYITGILEAEACMPASHAKEDEGLAEQKTLIMITSDRIGHGDDELGKRLMQNFINTLKEVEGLWRIIFMNNGVKLTVSDSSVLEALKELEDSGVQILVCGTCLDFFGLLEKKQIGESTNMLDIVTSLQLADKVIHI